MEFRVSGREILSGLGKAAGDESKANDRQQICSGRTR